MIEKKDTSILLVETQKDWEMWLSKHHQGTPQGIWLKMYKKSSGKKSITHGEALDEALCYGWIDAMAKSYDEESYIQRFVPRREKSMWSKRNTEHIARLTMLGKMKPSGIEQVGKAKIDGRWDRAYDSPTNTVIPGDFLEELAKNTNAQKFFGTLNKTNTYAIAWRLQTAKKPETRQRRMEKIIAMLARGEKFYE